MRWDELDDLYTPPSRALPADTRTRQRAELVAAIRSASPPGRPHRRGQRWPARTLALVAGAGVLGGGAAAATVLLAARQPEVTSIVSCFATADRPRTDPATYVELTFVHDDDLGRTAEVALELCAGPWSIGELSTRPPYLRPAADPNAAPDRPVPALVACVLPDGRVGIFPGDPSTCQARHLAPSLAGDTPIARIAVTPSPR